MLILSIKPGQRVKIGENITVMVTRLKGRAVRLGIEAPREIEVDREEIRKRKREGRAA